MIWAVLIFLGVPVWLCVAGILVLLLRNHGLRVRDGDIPVRVLRPGKTRWTRGHAVWVSDVFAWRGVPAAWSEDLVHVVKGQERSPTPAELRALHRLGDAPVVVSLTSDHEGPDLSVAASSDHRAALLGPFAVVTPRQDPANAE